MADLNNKYNIPCDGCAHNDICGIKGYYETTTVQTEHPYITVKLGCKRYVNASDLKKLEG